MKFKLPQIIIDYNKNINALLHGGYLGNFLEQHALTALIETYLEDVDTSNKDSLKTLLTDIYLLGYTNGKADVKKK